MFVILLGFISLLAVFLFHFSQISSYQRQADSILQNSTYIPSVPNQEKVSNAYSTGNSPDEKLARLDKNYDYQFIVQPVEPQHAHNGNNSQNAYDQNSNYINYKQENTNDLSNSHHYSNGQRMYYLLKIYIPYEDVTEKKDGHNGSYEVNPKDTSHYKTDLITGFHHQMLSKTICQVNNDNDENQAQKNRDS